MAEVIQPTIDRIQGSLRNGSRSISSDCSNRKFALVSPWSGGNLGNSAIISSVILNISRRIPGAEFVGITLSAEQTRRRYGIDAFPLAAGASAEYVQLDTVSPSSSKGQSHTGRQIKQFLKRIPLIGYTLKTVRAWSREVAHIAAATRIVRKMDGVVVPGGGALDEFWGGPWGHPWSLFKWSLLSRIYRVPFYFVSVGKCSLEHTSSKLFIRIALRLAAYRSYRDQNSQIAVQALIHAPAGPVFPDLAFSHPCEFAQNSKFDDRQKGGLVVGISPIAYCDPRVWPLKDKERYAAYLRDLAEIVKWLLSQGHQLIFFATDSPDLETIKEIVASVSGSRNDAGAFRILPGPVEQSVKSHLDAIAQADLIVASRLHGVILSHLISLPVLALSYDPKVDAHMESVNQTDHCLSIDAMKLDIFIKRFEALAATRLRVAAHLRSTALRFRQELDLQYDQLFGASSTLPGKADCQPTEWQ